MGERGVNAGLPHFSMNRRILGAEQEVKANLAWSRARAKGRYGVSRGNENRKPSNAGPGACLLQIS